MGMVIPLKPPPLLHCQNGFVGADDVNGGAAVGVPRRRELQNLQKHRNCPRRYFPTLKSHPSAVTGEVLVGEMRGRRMRMTALELGDVGVGWDGGRRRPYLHGGGKGIVGDGENEAERVGGGAKNVVTGGGGGDERDRRRDEVVGVEWDSCGVVKPFSGDEENEDEGLSDEGENGELMVTLWWNAGVVGV